MAGIALEGATTADVTANNHIQYRVWEYQGSVPDGNGGSTPSYGWGYYNTSATVKGICGSTATNVYVNGKKPVLNGDQTTENDTYSISSGEYYSGAHTNASGTVTNGNSRSVYINGKLVAVNGSSVTTHTNVSTTISQGSSNVNIG
jgi:hypothetical protein